MAVLLLDFDSPVDPTDKAKVNIQIFFVMFKYSLMYFNRVYSKERQLSDTLWSAVCCIRHQRSVSGVLHVHWACHCLIGWNFEVFSTFGASPTSPPLCQYSGCDLIPQPAGGLLS